MIAGKDQLLTGNEAIALGVVDGGLDLATGYPGTPSTDIIETLEGLAGTHQTHWHANEKTAMGMALGCAMHENARALVTMKHAGLNVAADPLKCIAISGSMGAVILSVGDDRGIHSSQNEFDSRNYATDTGLVVLEPADSQEAYDMAREGFLLSEESGNLVMLRTTTRVAHSRSVVLPKGKLPKLPLKPITHNPEKYVVAPMFARPNNAKLFDVEIDRRRRILEGNHFNFMEGPTGAEFGLICSGVAYNVVKEYLPLDRFRFLKLGAPLPLPIELVRAFEKTVEKMMVIEDGYTLKEQLLVHGFKLHGLDALPRHGEFTPLVAHNVLIKAGLIEGEERSIEPMKTTKRPPALCSGCPHRAMSYAVKMKGGPLVGDVGCYTLNSLAPLSVMSSAMDMGASIPMAEGSYHMDPSKKPICMIGDGTFLHSGIQGLMSAVDNHASITVLIMDNGTIAMTGQQQIASSSTSNVDLVRMVESIGVETVCEVDAHDMNQCTKALQDAEQVQGISVIIVRGTCIFIHPKYKETRRIGTKLKVNTDACTMCGQCLEIGCPSISVSDTTGKAHIDQTCIGCNDCIQVCNPCPVQTKVQKYTMAVERGQLEKAAEVIDKTNPFGFACGTICNAHCRTSAIVPAEGEQKDTPLQHAKIFPNFEALASAHKNGGPIQLKPSIDRRALIVGAGPAGLTAARKLAVEGVDVDLYEATDKPGGLMLSEIPDDKLPKEQVRRDVETILAIPRIKIHYRKALGDDESLSELAGRYDAVLLAIGGEAAMKIARAENLPSEGDGLVVERDQLIRENIYAAGDVVNGYGLDISRAIGAGKRAAESMLEQIHMEIALGGESALPEVDQPEFYMPEEVELMSESCDIFLGSVGGQGGVTATRIIANMFLDEGWHCKTSEIHGVAQKGGIVTANVRGSRNPIYAPVIPEGEAHIGLFFEPLEAMRGSHLICEGGVVIVNQQRLMPPSLTAISEKYPTDPLAEIRKLRPDLKIIATDTAHFVSDRKTGNVFLMGILSNLLPFPLESWTRVLKKNLPRRHVASNAEAFAAGRSWLAQSALVNRR